MGDVSGRAHIPLLPQMAEYHFPGSRRQLAVYLFSVSLERVWSFILQLYSALPAALQLPRQSKSKELSSEMRLALGKQARIWPRGPDVFIWVSLFVCYFTRCLLLNSGGCKLLL